MWVTVAVTWWDDASHMANWFLLCTGIALLLAKADIRPRWALALLFAGVGEIVAGLLVACVARRDGGGIGFQARRGRVLVSRSARH